MQFFQHFELLKLEILFFSKIPKSLDDIFLETHISTNLLDGPVIIYARLRDGELPVSGARITAYIRKPQGEVVELQLGDQGMSYHQREYIYSL